MSIKEIAIGRSDEYRVAPKDIHIRKGWNSRDVTTPENKAHIEELSRSIAEIGVQKALFVVYDSQDDKLYLDDGECRLRATWLAIERGAEIASVPVKNAVKGSTEADRLLLQIVANSGKSLSPLEMADVFYRLIKFGWDDKQIAAKTGKAKTYVNELLSLREAPESIRKQVSSGEVSATLASQTIRAAKGDKVKAAKTLKTAVKAAAKKGKKKATAKDAGMKSFKTEMKEIFARAKAIGSAMPGTAPTDVRFAAADLLRIKELLKLDW